MRNTTPVLSLEVLWRDDDPYARPATSLAFNSAFVELTDCQHAPSAVCIHNVLPTYTLPFGVIACEDWEYAYKSVA